MAKTTANDRFARSVIPTEDMYRIVKSIRREPTILQRLLGWLQTATVDDKVKPYPVLFRPLLQAKLLIQSRE